MQYEEFMSLVQRRTRLDELGARTAVQATLTTLGEYLSGGEGLDLAGRLPQGVGEHLQRRPPGRSEIFSLEDFVQIVGEKEETGSGEARQHARAVLGVLGEAVSREEMDDVRRQFPTEFNELFG